MCLCTNLGVMCRTGWCKPHTCRAVCWPFWVLHSLPCCSPWEQSLALPGTLVADYWSPCLVVSDPHTALCVRWGCSVSLSYVPLMYTESCCSPPFTSTYATLSLVFPPPPPLPPLPPISPQYTVPGWSHIASKEDMLVRWRDCVSHQDSLYRCPVAHDSACLLCCLLGMSWLWYTHTFH